jgi:hypothetical protein
MRRINDPQLLMDALEKAMELREKQEQESRKQLGEFVGRLLLGEEQQRDEQGRFIGEEAGDAKGD